MLCYDTINDMSPESDLGACRAYPQFLPSLNLNLRYIKANREAKSLKNRLLT